MEWIKKLGLAPFVFVLIVVLVISRVSNPDLFKSNANLAIKGALERKIRIPLNQLNNQSESYLTVNLSEIQTLSTALPDNTVHILFENLLLQQNQKILKEAGKPIILYSEDTALSIKAWVILNQLKFKNIYILEPEKNSEELKYKFRPDSTIRPESI